jgi:CheY-like chemotaxis protein
VNPTILIIDDCTDIARIISRYLESASYRTLVAQSGPEARRLLEHTVPDLIILDLMMPGMSGSELLHALRSDPKTAGIPVILVSARVGHYGTHFRTQFDVDYSVGKPFTRQQIVRAVQTVLARKAGEQPESSAVPPPAVARLGRLPETRYIGIDPH